MKKWIAALLTLLLVTQALPLEALASAGHILTDKELAAAYALTGYATDANGVKPNSALYHSGMKPNAAWNASQLSDYLDEALALGLHNVEDILSRASHTLAELAEKDPDGYRALLEAESKGLQRAQEICLEVEELRQELRYLKDRIDENANLIASMGERMADERDGMFKSDQVRYSAKIETAAKALEEDRIYVALNARDWEEKIELWQTQLQFGPAGEYENENFIGEMMTSLAMLGDGPVTNSAAVTAVNAGGSRLGRMASGQSVLSNSAEASVTVITKNQVCISLVAGESANRTPVANVEVRVRDVLKDGEDKWSNWTNKDGLVVLPTNHFTADEYDVIHMRLEVDPRSQGYREFYIEDLDLELGEVYTAVLDPLKGASGNGGAVSNAGDDPYIVSASFNGKDIMKSKYEMIYSELNDLDFTIQVEVANPGGKALPDLYMSYYENNGSLSLLKRQWVKATSHKGNVYTFKGPWKQKFSPNATKSQRPAFYFGEDERALHYVSQLVSVRGATGKPINEGTGAGGGVFGKVLGKGLGFSFKIPVVDVTMNLTVPWDSYLPKLSIDPAGNATMYIGSPMFADTVGKFSANWQSKDMKQFGQMSKWVEQKGLIANTKAQYNLARDYYKTKSWKLMGASKLQLGWFAVASARWELDNNNPDVKTKNIEGRVGAGFTISYSYSWTISYPVGPVPAYICFTLGVTAGYSMELKVAFCWYDGGFRNWKLTPLDNVTLNVRFSFSAQFGVGVKGFLEGWVKFAASLNVIIKLVIMGNDPTQMQITYALALSIGLTVFWVEFVKQFPIHSDTLWDSRASTANPLQAYARNDTPQTVEVAHTDPTNYPQLVAKATEVDKADSYTHVYSCYKRAAVGKQTFLFYVGTSKGKDGKTRKRVRWVNADNILDRGSLQDALDSGTFGDFYLMRFLNDRDDYAFDVYAADGFVFVVALSAKDFDENGNPKPNTKWADADGQNIFYYIMVLEPDGKGNLTSKLSVANQWNERYCFAMDFLRTESATDPQISYAAPVWKDRGNKKLNNFKILGGMPAISYDADRAPKGFCCFEYNGIRSKMMSDSDIFNQKGRDYDRVQAFITEGGQRENFQKYVDQGGQCLSFVALSKPTSGNGNSVIEMYDMEMGYWPCNTGSKNHTFVVDEGPIEWIQVIPERGAKGGSRVFYAMKEENDEGDAQYRLYGLNIEPIKAKSEGGNSAFELDVSKYEYDMVLPTNRFEVVYLGETPYLYWINAAPTQQANGPVVWRIWIAGYDASTNSFTDPAVFSQFEVPRLVYWPRDQWGQGHTYYLDVAMKHVILTGTGTAFFDVEASNMEQITNQNVRPDVAPKAVYSFPEQLKPVADITMAVPEALAVAAGDFADINLGVMNEGNLSIAAFDVTMYEVGASAVAVETAHINALDPSKNKLTMANGKVEITGKQVAYRLEDYDLGSRRQDWVLGHERTAFKLETGLGKIEKFLPSQKLEDDNRYVKTDILMPGSTGSFNAAFRIPEGWKGKKKLRFAVTGVSIRSNLAGPVANAAGEDAMLTYALDERTGKLVLQRPAQANGIAANAIHSGLYANEIETSYIDLDVSIQDLEVSHRQYTGWDGGEWVDITINNHAAIGEDMRLTCAVYVDGAEEPVYVNLPYYKEAMSGQRTHTITVPVSALVGDPSAHSRARVVIGGVDVEERAYSNNEFYLWLDGEDALALAAQPLDRTIQPGESAAFTVKAKGGTQPYACQWQVWDPKNEKWVDLKGCTEPTLAREKVEKKWNGARFRCVITDAAGTQVVSAVATLTVRDAVPTGDTANLPLYLAIALAALLLLWLVRRRARG